jgi:hypothetical protein
MAQDWVLPPRGYLMRLDRERRFGRPAHPSVLQSIRKLADLVERRPRPPVLKCLAVGVIVALLYVWPVEFMVYLFTGGYSRAAFNALLAGGVVVGASAAWIITARELRHWEDEDSLDTLPDYGAPAPWR